jgi:FkbM family methyltransferase
MSFPRNFVLKIFDFIVSKTPYRIAKSLEWRIQKVLGKGIGYGSLSHEVRTIKIFLRLLGNQSPIVFDVGANQGQFAIEFFNQMPMVQIHSFEPSHDAFHILRLKSQLNKNWSVYNFGFGATSAEMKLYSEIPGSASSTLINKNYQVGKNDIDFQYVKILKLDEFLSSNPKLVPDVLKIDIEGFELSCLEGSLEHLNLIKIIQFEFGQINVDARVFFKDYWRFFNTRDFLIFRVSSKSPIAIAEYSEDLETFSVTNYLAINNRFFKSEFFSALN